MQNASNGQAQLEKEITARLPTERSVSYMKNSIFVLLLACAVSSLGLSFPWQENPQETNNEIQKANNDMPANAQNQVLEIDRLERLERAQVGSAGLGMPSAMAAPAPAPNVGTELPSIPKAGSLNSGTLPPEPKKLSAYDAGRSQRIPGSEKDVAQSGRTGSDDVAGLVSNIATAAGAGTRKYGKTPKDAPSAPEMPEKQVQDPPEAPSLASANAGNVVEKLQKLQGLQKLNRNPSKYSGGIPDIANIGKVADVGLVNKISAGNRQMGAGISDVQSQIDKLIRVSRSTGLQNRAQTRDLQRIIDLSHKHQKILEELRQVDEENANVTVVDEEEILRQQEIRMQKKQG